jgi:tetratricopeptide (TPR) repeat protein
LELAKEHSAMRKLLLPIVAASALFAGPAMAINFSDPSGDRHARIEFDIGVDLVTHQKYVASTPHLESALEQFPNDTDILGYLGFAHRMIAKSYTGSAHDAELRLSNEYYRRALNINPDRKDFLEYMGELYLEMDDPQAAKTQLAELKQYCPDGCPEHDRLATSIESYQPHPPVVLSDPNALPPQPAD